MVDNGWPMQAVQRWENLGVIWSIPFPKWCPLLHCLQFNPPNVASKIICIFIPSPIPCSAIFQQYSLSLYIFTANHINPYKFPPLTNPSTNYQKKIRQKKRHPITLLSTDIHHLLPLHLCTSAEGDAKLFLLYHGEAFLEPQNQRN